MASTVNQLLGEHSRNPGYNPRYPSNSKKNWTSKFEPIHNLRVHTAILESGMVVADFGAFLPDYRDEQKRMALPSNRPNDNREWYLAMEEDGKSWFNTEVSNVVLSAFTLYPGIRQELEAKPLSTINIPETVDMMYTLRVGNIRAPVAIGETKRNILRPEEWQAGRLRNEQQLKLSQELRGQVKPL